jgi:ABC-type multidrug transport system ATPase subunit
MRLEAVGKRYGVRQPWVVRDVSADVDPGSLIRLVGRNGSGKSTLLRVAAGVCLPSRGKVTGRPHTGYVPERFPGTLPFTGREYLLHLARVHGLRGAAAAGRVDDCLERLGAAGHADQPLRGLSKGMCQKIAIAQALLPPSGLLVLDEAWTGLDTAARGALDNAALERVSEGATVMFVDHDPGRLRGRAHEHWRLDGDGRVTVTSGDDIEASGDTALSGDTGVSSDTADGDVDVTAQVTMQVTMRVAAARSDEVLREVRTLDGVRIVSVRTEDSSGHTEDSERSGGSAHTGDSAHAEDSGHTLPAPPREGTRRDIAADAKAVNESSAPEEGSRRDVESPGKGGGR